MNRNRIADRDSSELMRTQFSSSKDSLGIDNATFIRNHAKNQLIILVETSKKVGYGLEASVNEGKLNLRCNGNRFSEIQLHSGFKYYVISRRAMEANLIKIILGFRPVEIIGHN